MLLFVKITIILQILIHHITACIASLCLSLPSSYFTHFCLYIIWQCKSLLSTNAKPFITQSTAGIQHCCVVKVSMNVKVKAKITHQSQEGVQRETAQKLQLWAQQRTLQYDSHTAVTNRHFSTAVVSKPDCWAHKRRPKTKRFWSAATTGYQGLR